MQSIEILLANSWVWLHTIVSNILERFFCYGMYDGRNLKAHRNEHGPVDVLFAIPPMSDVNGALPHPGVRILQTILRDQGHRCEVINYNLPVTHPRNSTEHLIQAIRTLDVKILGVSTYSQAIRSTLETLQKVKSACPNLKIVLGGPHPTESYLSLLGVSFIDYVCRGESEESFPLLVKALLAGKTDEAGSIPGVYHYDRASDTVVGKQGSMINLDDFDSRHLLRYSFSEDEQRQQRLYRGCHGTAGAEYWPVALVRGCPYNCTFCCAYLMSGKKLRFRTIKAVVDELEYYSETYGRRHFSFIDDAFTERYEYVVELCEEIIRRGLKVCWTTDNGIRYETLGRGKRLEACMKERGLETVDELLRLMIRAGWRGTAIGVESGSARVRRDLVRKGGVHLDNRQIQENLYNLKRIAKEEGVYFYNNGFIMAGFPELPLRSGKVIPAETEEERAQTLEFALELRDSGAIDMMNVSIVIPLPGSDMWECLTIRDKLNVLLSCVPENHPGRESVERIREELLVIYGEDLEGTRYKLEPEELFWKKAYTLPDSLQILIMQSYDSFNADTAHKIDLDRPDSDTLWEYREGFVTTFYAGIRMKLRMLKHIILRSNNIQDMAAYLTLMGRKYDPESKGLIRKVS